MKSSNLSESKVVGFKDESVLGYYNTFLNIKERKSINTRNSYDLWIREFMSYTFGKDIEHLTWDNLYNLKSNDVELFIEYLTKNKSNSGKTVNNKLASINSLFRYLKRDNKRINEYVFSTEKLNEEDKEFTPFTEDEINALIQFCLTKERNLKLDKALFFETCFITALRKTATLNLRWDDISQRQDLNTGKYIWTIKTKDKGNKYDVIAISDEFYNKLITLKDNGAKNTRVFNISEKPLYDTLKRYCEYANIDRKNRKISIHSIKKTSGDVGWGMTKDPIALQKHMHHNDFNTTLKYINANTDLSSQISYQIGQKLDASKLENASKEDIIEAIKKSGNVILREILSSL